MQLNNIQFCYNAQRDFQLNWDSISERLHAMWSGDKVNHTEDKQALFVLARQFETDDMGMPDEAKFMLQNDQKMADWVEDGYLQGIEHIVSIGFGGSSLGLQLIDQAFDPLKRMAPQIHFVDYCDNKRLSALFSKLEPKKTLVCFISKSATTREILFNKRFIDQHHHQFRQVIITANSVAANKLGFQEKDQLLFHEAVNGRMSIWSTVIFPIAFKYGMASIKAFRHGAVYVDQQVKSEGCDSIAATLASLSIKEQQAQSQGVHFFLNYDFRLEKLGAYIQQLEMESLGKPFTIQQKPVSRYPGQCIIALDGFQAAHSVMQYVHQSPQMISLTYAICKDEHANYNEASCHLNSNYEVLSAGFSDPHQGCHSLIFGNKPTRKIELDKLSFSSLGTLLAIYEYKTIIEAFHYEINPFDQFGVERPKQIMKKLLEKDHENS